jgi:hypothetical protein
MKPRSTQAGATATLIRFWWLPAAFIGPCLLFLNPAWQINATTTTFNGIRAGLVGLVIACIVYVLWKIDCRLNRNIKPDRGADVIILLFGVMLWFVWFTTCQMILIAGDEVSHADYPQRLQSYRRLDSPNNLIAAWPSPSLNSYSIRI